MEHRINPVQIKGQKDGLWILLDDTMAVADVFDALEQKLSSSNNFFAGAEVTVHAGSRAFSSDEHQRLHSILEERYELHIKDILERVPPPGKVPTSQDLLNARFENQTESQSPVAEDDGSVGIEDTEESDEVGNIERTDTQRFHDADDDFMKAPDETFWIPVRPPRARQEPEDSDEHFYDGEANTLYFRGTVRSGQSLEYSGNIVILGDVNPGAYVIASGDIVVMGRMNGVVHAGAEGEERAVVIGASFSPSQLRIAHYIGRAPDDTSHGKGGHRAQTEKASIKDGNIVIEPIV
jgi:septum site-determining protein MinC